MKRSEFIDEAYRKADKAGRIDDEMVIRFYLDMFLDMGMLPPSKHGYNEWDGQSWCKWEDESESEMDVLENGRVTITKNELVDVPNIQHTDYDYRLMMLLRNAGAPIVGIFNPKPNTELYEWSNELKYAVNDYVYIYTWKLKD